MIAPVSVCHQLSWTVRWSDCCPQTTTSGLSASPTLATCRSADRSNSPARSARARISIRRAVGAVYQTFTWWSCSTRYQRRASNSPASVIAVTPCVSGAISPYDVPVTHPGSAVHQ